MKNDYIALIDSGVGGLSVLKEAVKVMPNEKFIYFGDNNNAPYGEKSKNELLQLTRKNIDVIKKYQIKCLILACNTISTAILSEVEEYVNVKTFGVFPPVESAVLENKKTLLLATPNTCKNYQTGNNLTVYPQIGLAKQIEENIFCLNNINLSYLDKYYKHYNNVILGCTHYELIKNQICNHLQPQKILSGTSFTVKKVKKYLINAKLLGNNKRYSILFLGDNSSFNKKVWENVVINV